MDVHRKHCFHPGTSLNEKIRAAQSHCNFDSIDHQHKGKEHFFFEGKVKNLFHQGSIENLSIMK